MHCRGTRLAAADVERARDNCSVDKIEQFSAELKNPETSQGERLAATRFLLNLVGDLHDPLNAIDRGDRGGECIALQIGSKASAS